MDAFAEGVRLALAVVLALAAVEKASTLLSRSSLWHPVIVATAWRRKNATSLMAASLAADATSVALLILDPGPAGPILAASLAFAYSIAVRRVAWTGADGCRCFWRFFDARSLRAVMARNSVLVAEAVLAAFMRPAALRPAAFLWTIPLLLVPTVAIRLAEAGGLRAIKVSGAKPPADVVERGAKGAAH